MDNTRARQILNGKSNINVLYQGTPVWIEAVNDNDIANVTSLSGNKSKMQVSVNMLEEKG